jgi:hypothetical protein
LRLGIVGVESGCRILASLLITVWRRTASASLRFSRMMRGEKQLRHLTFLLNFFDELRRREWRDSLVSNLLELCCSDRECIVGYPSINNAERRAAQNLSRLGVLEIGRMRGIIVRSAPFPDQF